MTKYLLLHSLVPELLLPFDYILYSDADNGGKNRCNLFNKLVAFVENTSRTNGKSNPHLYIDIHS